jgi:hypothetical protein
VLIDRRQRRWILVTGALTIVALVIYFWLARSTPGGLTGGSTVGLWYGAAGSALMIFAGLLSALRRVPSWWWIGSRKAWLRGHVWLGLLSVVLILCHSGFRWGGPLEIALWLVLGLVIAAGVFGLAVQQVLPRMITTRIATEAPYEQIPHLCQEMRKRANALVEEILAGDQDVSTANLMDSQIGIAAHIRFLEFFGKEVQPFLADRYPPSCLMSDALQTENKFAYFRALPAFAEVKPKLTMLENICDERRQLADQEHLHHWLHGWLLVHIPVSLLLLVLALAHAVVSLYY